MLGYPALRQPTQPQLHPRPTVAPHRESQLLGAGRVPRSTPEWLIWARTANPDTRCEKPQLVVTDSVIWLSVSARCAARLEPAPDRCRSSRCQWFGHLAVSRQGGPVGSGAWMGLAALADAGRLGSEQVRSAAGAMGVSERTVWRWVGQAHAGEGLDRRPPGRFQVTGEVRQRLAFWRDNAAAVHRELAAAAWPVGAEPVDAAACGGPGCAGRGPGGPGRRGAGPPGL